MTNPAADKSSAGPDFICIGAQKAGTGWLYEQLRNHPDFWMPPMKELHYFDRVGGDARSEPERTLPFVRDQNERLRVARKRARDQRDNDFLDSFEHACDQRSLDLESYAALFRRKGNSISGDITPGYSTLSDETVKEIATRFPRTKISFIARDPVERAWSQLSMYVRNGLIDRFDPDDLDQLSQHLHRPEILSRSYPTQIVSRWRRHVAPDLFGLYFFDDLKREPSELRASIFSFLGGDPAKSSGQLAPDYNAKAEKQKLPLTPSARSHLAEFFADELRACAVELGGPASEWPKRYKP